MTTIALFGAGGKMGFRLAQHLQRSRFSTRYVEVSPAGQQRLKDELGIACSAPDAALEGVEVVILAVPDTLIRRIATEIAPKLKAGTMVMALDAAAPFAGHLPARPDLTYFVTHPCHPPIFSDETEPAALADHFGGVAAKQSVVNALMQGPEEAYALGAEIAETIWAPVLRTHRVSVEQMAFLEPGLSETVAATLLDVMREARDEVVARGVPAQAAQDFLLGHLNVLAAVIFGVVEGRFSDACNKAIEFGKPALMRADWKHVFEPGEIAASIRRIT